MGSEGREGEGVARTSHSAAVQGDSMWVVGGEFLHRAPPGSMVSIGLFYPEMVVKILFWISGEKVAALRAKMGQCHSG